MLNIGYVYELVQKSPLDLFRLPNFGEKSLREVKAKLATLGLTLGMTLEDDTYRAAVVATVAAHIGATRG
jgi:DNA-directed RNA polymerase alpha subunit